MKTYLVSTEVTCGVYQTTNTTLLTAPDAEKAKMLGIVLESSNHESFEHEDNCLHEDGYERAFSTVDFKEVEDADALVLCKFLILYQYETYVPLMKTVPEECWEYVK